MLLIQNAYLINPADSREGICDIAIGNGRFLAIEAFRRNGQPPWRTAFPETERSGSLTPGA